MLAYFTMIILVFLHTTESKKMRELGERPTELIIAVPGETINLSCKTSNEYLVNTVVWYKEKDDQSLRLVNVTYLSRKPGENVGEVNYTIRNVTRKDSGLYFCATMSLEQLKVLNRTKVIVQGPSKPTLSILVPSTLEEVQLKHHIPILCLVSDAKPGQEAFSWNAGGNSTLGLAEGDLINDRGVFTVWRLQLVPVESWNEGGRNVCSHPKDNRTISADTTSTEKCSERLYYGMPFILLILLIVPLVFRFRKNLAKGDTDRAADQVAMVGTPQTTYAELCGHQQTTF